MKKLLFDLTASQPNTDGDFHGGGKYAKKIFLALFDDPDLTISNFFCFYNANVPLDDLIAGVIADKNITNYDVNTISVSEIIAKEGIDILYSALPNSFMEAAIKEKKCKVISTVHGLRFMETKLTMDALTYEKGAGKIKLLAKIALSGWVDKKFYNYYKNLIKETNVITVSNHSKYSIMSYFSEFIDNAATKIKVFYSPDVTDFGTVENKNGAKFQYSDYFLLVSGNRWVKNNLRSILALDELFSDYKTNHKVIITGIKDPSIFKAKLKNPDKFIFLGYVEEDLLANLYKNAFALVYMSLNEGFGYPPLEAMKFGIPVITCPFTSITEVCGDAALYANPFSVKEIKNRLLWVLNDSQKYTELSNKSYNQFNTIRHRQEQDLKGLVSYILN